MTEAVVGGGGAGLPPVANPPLLAWSAHLQEYHVIEADGIGGLVPLTAEFTPSSVTHVCECPSLRAANGRRTASLVDLWTNLLRRCGSSRRSQRKVGLMRAKRAQGLTANRAIA